LYKFTPINSHHTSTMALRKAAKKGNVARSAATTAAAKFNSKRANTPAIAAAVAAPAGAAATATATAAAPTSKSKRKGTKSADAAVAAEAAANVAATASPASAAAATAVAAAASSARKKCKGTKSPAVADATASAASAKSPVTATTAATPAAATTAPNAGTATVATGKHITRRSQRIAEENEVDRRSRYVFLNLYDFFYTICRLLVRMFFANHIRTCITDSYVGATYTNLYHLRLVTIYELVYLRKILRLCMVTSYELVYFRLSTIRIPPTKLVHHLTVQIHRQTYTNLILSFYCTNSLQRSYCTN
jgi:hypothetical protein